MSGDHPSPIIDLTFPHNWQAEILPARPLILPNRHFIYPREAEEVERGALEVLIHPSSPAHAESRVDVLKGHDFSRAEIDADTARALAPAEKLNERGTKCQGTTSVVPQNATQSGGALAPEGILPSLATKHPPSVQEFLATCALGFRDAIVPTGLWSCPNPDEICAVSGGYAYILSTTDPTSFTMLHYRPVLEVRAVAGLGLLIFISHHSILAWSATGQAWQSEKLSDEGLTITAIEAENLRARGWNMLTDKEVPFTLDLKTGLRI